MSKEILAKPSSQSYDYMYHPINCSANRMVHLLWHHLQCHHLCHIRPITILISPGQHIDKADRMGGILASNRTSEKRAVNPWAKFNYVLTLLQWMESSPDFIKAVEEHYRYVIKKYHKCLIHAKWTKALKTTFTPQRCKYILASEKSSLESLIAQFTMCQSN
jgi:hypothetical protein